MHTHEHSHTDENGNVYTHSHEHLHDHGTDVHDHNHTHEHHHHEHAGTPKEELIAMLKYMVGHNAAHVQETKELAEQLKEENPGAYEKIAEAVAQYEKGNVLLKEALELTQA